MRTIFDFLRRLLDAKHREVAALEKIELHLNGLELEAQMATAQLEDVVAALEGIQESLLNRPDAERYTVAWQVGVPQPEGE